MQRSGDTLSPVVLACRYLARVVLCSHVVGRRLCCGGHIIHDVNMYLYAMV